jgi:hypothetical protein
MAIIWACPLTPEGYAAAGRQVSVPPQVCPACRQRLIGWGGTWRWVRLSDGQEQRLWIRRGHCRTCRRTHRVLPAFLFLRRLDVGAVIGEAVRRAVGGEGLRPIAAALTVPHTTVRTWWDRVRQRAPALLPPLLALATALDPAPVDVATNDVAAVLAVLGVTWRRAQRRLGTALPDGWAFWSLVSGGAVLAAHSSPPFPRGSPAGWMKPSS